MNPFAGNDYLTTEVLTASPHKLQLMMLDAALRNAQKTGAGWQSQRLDLADDAMQKCQEIVNSLLAGLSRAPRSPLVERQIAVYVFIYRTLIEAHHTRDESKLQAAVRVLEIERETWRQVCDKLGSKPAFPTFDSDMPTSLGTSFVA